VCSEDAPGETYREAAEEVRTAPRMVMGDNGGFVYKFDPTYTDYDGQTLIARHPTPVFDMQVPDKFKRWEKLSYVAREKTSGNGAIFARYRTGNFDTSDTGWTDYSQALTGEWAEHEIYINRGSKCIQFEFRDFSGMDFEVKSYELFGDIEDNR
jgi:hypothetical protein